MMGPDKKTTGLPTQLGSLSTTPAGLEVKGYLFDLRYGPDHWSRQRMFSNQLPSDPDDVRNVEPLVTLSQAQSALAAMREERDEALRLAGEDVDALQAIGDEFGIEPGEHRVTGVRRLLTAFRAEVKRLTETNEALKAAQDEADNALVDKYRDPKTGFFKFPTDVAAIVRRLETAEARVKALEAALGNMRCPRPCNHRPDEFDAKDCVAAGECGCGAAILSGGLNAPS